MTEEHEVDSSILEDAAAARFKITNGSYWQNISGTDSNLIEFCHLRDQRKGRREQELTEALRVAKEALLDANRNGFTRDLPVLEQINTVLRAQSQVDSQEAAEPVFPELPSVLVKHPQLGDLYDRLQMHGYAVKCMFYPPTKAAWAGG